MLIGVPDWMVAIVCDVSFMPTLAWRSRNRVKGEAGQYFRMAGFRSCRSSR
jgi:hypothetical protein